MTGRKTLKITVKDNIHIKINFSGHIYEHGPPEIPFLSVNWDDLLGTILEGFNAVVITVTNSEFLLS